MDEFTIRVTYAGCVDERRTCASFGDARRYCRDHISYRGPGIHRVEIVSPTHGVFAVWDHTWDAASQRAGLYN